MKKSDKLHERIQGDHDGHRNSGVGILIVDMISDFDFDDGEKLYEAAEPAARRIAKLKERANKNAIPIIYVNDNYGQWKNDFSATVRSAQLSSMGRKIVDIVPPQADDYHVLKPQRSGFFGTPLTVLLECLNVSELVITGVTTDICVLFTAHDAYMRGFSVSVPADCCAAVRREDHESALSTLARIADADIGESEKITLNKARISATQKNGSEVLP
jgi:nicotinamidase-related amidase